MFGDAYFGQIYPGQIYPDYPITVTLSSTLGDSSCSSSVDVSCVATLSSTLGDSTCSSSVDFGIVATLDGILSDSSITALVDLGKVPSSGGGVTIGAGGRRHPRKRQRIVTLNDLFPSNVRKKREIDPIAPIVRRKRKPAPIQRIDEPVVEELDVLEIVQVLTHWLDRQ